MPTVYSIASPILHDCKLIRSSTVFLGENISVRTIRSEHLGAILKKSPSSSSLVKPNCKCIVIDHGTIKPDLELVEIDLLATTFALNSFAKSGSLVHSRAYLISQTRVNSVKKIHDLQSLATPEKHEFSIRPGVSTSDISSVYVNVKNAIQRDPKFMISVRRFNAALTKVTPDEKIIDLTICLESMFASQNEIAFQFSLFNSLLAENDDARRHEVFKLLKKLYSWRSKIVHGSHILDPAWFEDNWAKLVRLATLSILYKTDYLTKNKPSDWGDHLIRTALGMEIDV